MRLTTTSDKSFVVVFKSNTEVIYKVSAYYSPGHDRGLLRNDPALGIAWPVSADQT
jgi:dTDP-4-dehydrorhamnose 3,5-epimerase